MTVSHDPEVAAVYALGALTADERSSYEEHLDGCAECRSQVAALSDAAAALAFAAPAAAPPAELRSRLLERARADRPLAPVVPLRRLSGRVAGGLAAAAACAALGLGLWAASLHRSLADEREARGTESRAAAVLGDPAATRVPVRGASGILAVGRDGTAVLALRAIAPAPSGKTYEAWVISRDTTRAAGLFSAGEGRSTLVPLTRPVPAGATVAVTIERSGGVAQPTGKPIFSAPTPAA